MTQELTCRAEAVSVQRFYEEALSLTDDELMQAIEADVVDVAARLMCLAARVKLADERGLDLSMLRPGRRRLLLNIANGELSARAAEMFQGTQIAAVLPRLPLAEQERLADGGTVKVYSFEGGDPAYREVNPLDLSRVEFQQAFGPDGYRTVAGQRSYLEGIRKMELQKTPKPSDLPTINKRGGFVAIPPHSQEMRITKSQLAIFLAQLEA